MTTPASSKTSKQPKQKKKQEAGASSPSSPTSAPSGESTRRPLSALKANPKNPRLPFTDAQTEAFKRSLAEYGDLSGIIENQRTGQLVGGHKRVEQFVSDPNAYAITTHRLDQPDASGTLAYGYVETGGTRFAYRLVNWPVEKEKAANLAANQFGAEFDWPEVQNMLAELEGKIDLSLTGFSAEEMAQIKDQFSPEPTQGDAEPQIDRAAELNKVWQVKTGDLWRIGEHRLLCGDSTKREDVHRVMGGEKARLVATDPPYGVKYGDKLNAANPVIHRVRSIQNDNLTPENLESFWRSAFVIASEIVLPGGAIYAAAAAGNMLLASMKAFECSGFTFKWQLVWIKDRAVMSRGDYHFRHENILYGWKEDGAHFFTDDRKQTSVFEYARPSSSDEHPTMKPPELYAHLLKNSSQRGDVVYEPFCGSGTTMVACQNLARCCRAIEISPDYCAVVLQRMQDAFPGISIERV